MFAAAISQTEMSAAQFTRVRRFKPVRHSRRVALSETPKAAREIAQSFCFAIHLHRRSY